jgi:hypothetical protein
MNPELKPSNEGHEKNFTPLWKEFLFPLLGLAADTAIIATKGFPPIIFMVAFFVTLGIGSVFTVTTWKDEADTNIPAIIATVGPLLSLIIGLSI